MWQAQSYSKCGLCYRLGASLCRFGYLALNAIMVFLENMKRINELLMRKFTSTQFMKDLPLPTVFQEVFKPVLDKRVLKQSGSLQDQMLSEHDNRSESQSIRKVSRFSIGPLQKVGMFACTDSLYTCCGPFSRDCIEADALPHLKKCYAAIFDDFDQTSVTTHFGKYASCKFNGGSIKSRGHRSRLEVI